jgi:hypothetical protein
MFRIISYSKSTDDNSYYIVLDDNGSEVIVKTRSYKVKPMHQKQFIRKDVTILGECDHQKVYYYLVDRYPLFLYYVPEEYLCETMIDSAVQRNGNTLSFISKDKRTLKRCYLAVLENGLCYRFIPSEIRCFNMAYLAVNNNGLALRYVEDEYKSFDLCLRAVSSNRDAIEWVPTHLVDSVLKHFNDNNELLIKM